VRLIKPSEKRKRDVFFTRYNPFGSQLIIISVATRVSSTMLSGWAVCVPFPDILHSFSGRQAVRACASRKNRAPTVRQLRDYAAPYTVVAGSAPKGFPETLALNENGFVARTGDDQPIRPGRRMRQRSGQAVAAGRPLAVRGKRFALYVFTSVDGFRHPLGTTPLLRTASFVLFASFIGVDDDDRHRWST